jgi:hypothetical protein
MSFPNPSIFGTSSGSDKISWRSVLFAGSNSAASLFNSKKLILPSVARLSVRYLLLRLGGVTYTVYHVGSLFFPTTSQGMTASPDFPRLLKAYFTQIFLQQNSETIAAPLKSLTGALSSITSNAPSAASTAYLSYSVTIPLVLTSITVSSMFAGFLKWTIPGSEIGLSDIGVADLIAKFANQFGITISGDDIRAFADFLAEIGNAESLDGYLAILLSYSQLVSGLTWPSSGVLDTQYLIQALEGASNISDKLASILGSVNQILSSTAQRIWTWIRQLRGQLYNVFDGMEKWISQNLSVIANSINSFLNWLYQTLDSALGYVYNVLQGLFQAHDAIITSQSQQNGLSAMSVSVPTESTDASSALSDRLQQVAGQMQQQFNQLCSKYEPIKDQVKAITKWGGLAASYAFGPFTEGASIPAGRIVVPGLLLGEDGLSLACDLSTNGLSDVIQRISFADGASTLIDDLFLPGGSFDSSVGGIIGFLGTVIPIAQQLQAGFSSSGYDLSGISSLISSYQSQYNKADSAYRQPSPDYVAALEAIANLSSLPSIDAVSSVLQNIQDCSGIITKFQGYTQEGMVAPDLQSQVQVCQQTGQSAISSILSGQYSATMDVGGLPALASQLRPEIEARHQQFVAARNSMNQLNAAVSSIDGCGFLWAQPDPSVVSQAHETLQLAQSQFSSGKYSDVMNTASQDSITKLTTACQACDRESTNAKLELICAIFAAIAVSGFAYFRRKGAREVS